MVVFNVPVVKKRFPNSQTQVVISKLVKETRSKIAVIVIYVKNYFWQLIIVKSILERHLKTHKDNPAQKKLQSVLNPTDAHADDDFISSLVFPDRNLMETVNTNESNIDDIFYEECNVVGQTEVSPQIDSQSEPKWTTYFKQYCEWQRKVNNLETIISNLTSPQKREAVDQFSKRHSSTDTDYNKEYQSYTCNSLIRHLKSVWGKGLYPAFHKLLY